MKHKRNNVNLCLKNKTRIVMVKNKKYRIGFTDFRNSSVIITSRYQGSGTGIRLVPVLSCRPFFSWAEVKLWRRLRSLLRLHSQGKITTENSEIFVSVSRSAIFIQFWLNKINDRYLMVNAWFKLGKKKKFLSKCHFHIWIGSYR